MNTIKPEELIKLLGRSITDPEIELLKERTKCEVTEIDPIVGYSFPDQGFSLEFNDNNLSTIMVFSEGVEDFHEYPYPLPHGLRFSMKKAEVRALLGKPIQTGTDTDIFKFPDHVLYVEYLGKAKSVSTLTLMTLEKFAE